MLILIQFTEMHMSGSGRIHLHAYVHEAREFGDRYRNGRLAYAHMPYHDHDPPANHFNNTNPFSLASPALRR
jgi:hypothetical protein